MTFKELDYGRLFTVMIDGVSHYYQKTHPTGERCDYRLNSVYLNEGRMSWINPDREVEYSPLHMMHPEVFNPTEGRK